MLRKVMLFKKGREKVVLSRMHCIFHDLGSLN